MGITEEEFIEQMKAHRKQGKQELKDSGIWIE